MFVTHIAITASSLRYFAHSLICEDSNLIYVIYIGSDMNPPMTDKW